MGSVVVVVEALLPYTKCPVNKVGKLDQKILALFGKSLVKKEDVLDEDEIFDLVQSLFDCLFCLLSSVENKKRFADAGGVHLMLQIVKQEKLNNFYYGSAIAALDIALEHCPSASNKFISSSITHKGDEIEGHLMSLITTLTLTDGSTGVKKDALLDKFEENGYITGLLDLFTQYYTLPLDQSELYDEKLEYKLSTLQVLLCRRSTIRAKVEAVKEDVLRILKEYRDNIGNTGGSVKIAAKTVIKYIVSLEKEEVILNSQGGSKKPKKKKKTLTIGGSRR
ncbi:hypothetical protein C5167_047151 [Papaver somniferum]|uniref:Beta-catenin-like protein 1 N-terminal domain-containing protein n=1 Tax=Papaver somniferum TaxID=3469 RepID=A0A4Y7LFT0_PAPSO|nr:hypothetical protein C5167_047151 [Papaver somniferum]